MLRRIAIGTAFLIPVIAACLGAGPAAAAGPSPAAGAAPIPNFFDPNRRLDRPLAGSVGSIRFTTTDDFPPFSFLGPDGQPTKFNVNLARAIYIELTVPYSIQVRPFDGLIDTITAGQVDAAIAGIAITPETRAKLEFSDVYLRPAARFAVKSADRDRTISPAALNGRRVGVVKGSAHEAYLAAFFPLAEPVGFDKAAEAEAALKAGTVDLVFGDGGQLAFWLQSAAADTCCAFAGGPYLEPRYFGQGFAIALPPGRDDLRHAVDWALDSLYDKGIFADIYLRYFPVGYF
jgi:polar amino acid transport system substrate-binding protein